MRRKKLREDPRILLIYPHHKLKCKQTNQKQRGVKHENPVGLPTPHVAILSHKEPNAQGKRRKTSNEDKL